MGMSASITTPVHPELIDGTGCFSPDREEKIARIGEVAPRQDGGQAVFAYRNDGSQCLVAMRDLARKASGNV
jgi:hypothetical protein